MKVMVAMSGGVDSSVAALLLRRDGHEVAGVTMCLGVEEDAAGGCRRTRCCGPEAVGDARAVCRLLGVPHVVADFAPLLEERVVAGFVRAYLAGRTPNPCVDCNRFLKLDALLGHAAACGYDFLATGHYAATAAAGGALLLARPRDRARDQTYFLCRVPPASLARTLFPLAALTKEEVRAIAREAGLPVAAKRGSQDLCFVGRGGLAAFLRARAGGAAPGEIVDTEGRVVGAHAGLASRTIGQRAGGGRYVVAKEPAANRIVVGPRGRLLAAGLLAVDVSLFAGSLPGRAAAQTRYRRAASPCALHPVEGGVRVAFDEPEEASAAGQTVAFRDGDLVLGGGEIDSTF